MKKFTLFFLILAFASTSLAAGDGSIGNPWTTTTDVNNAFPGSVSCGNTYYISGNTVASPTEYTSNITLDKDCTEGNRITLSVSNGTSEVLGGAWFSDGVIYIGGDYTTVQGLKLTSDAYINVQSGATYPEITEINCDGNGSWAIACIDFGGGNATNSEIHHNTFQNTSGKYVIRLRLDSRTNPKNYPFHVHHNAIVSNLMSSNREVIQLGDGAESSGMDASGTIFEYNYFYDNDDNDGSGDELVSIKASNIVFRYNVVEDNDSHITLRGGEGARVYSNFFYLADKPRVKGHGIRAYGANHKIYNNYFEAPLCPSKDTTYGISERTGYHRESGTVSSISGTNIEIASPTLVADRFDCDVQGDDMWLWLYEGNLEYAYSVKGNDTNTIFLMTNSDCVGNDNPHICCSGANAGYCSDRNDPVGNEGYSAGGGSTFWVVGANGVTQDTIFVNNTIYSSCNEENVRLAWSSYPVDPFNITWQNNLIVNTHAGSGADGFEERNSAYTGRNYTFLDNIAWVTSSASEWESSYSSKPAEVYADSECTWVGSNSCDPGMTASTDMYIPQAGYAAENAGTAHADITVDIYGNTRSDPPDIGAYEIGGSIPSTEPVGCSYAGCGSHTVPSHIEVSDTVDPVVTVTSPTSEATYDNGTSNSIALGGTCTDNISVSRVDWANADSGGGGTATGTDTWSVTVALIEGTNAITMTCYDTSNNTGTDLITVTYTAESITEPPSVGNQLGGTFY